MQSIFEGKAQRGFRWSVFFYWMCACAADSPSGDGGVRGVTVVRCMLRVMRCILFSEHHWFV